MRTAAVLLTLAALAACAHDPPASKAGLWEAAREAAADDPRIMMAHPEAANYAPPGWPLEIGQRISIWDWRRLDKQFGDAFGMGTVWVVSKSGLSGALPFVAGFVNPPRGTPRSSDPYYIGHVPTWPSSEAWHLEPDMPEALLGVVDLDDARWRSIRTSPPFGDFTERERSLN